MSVGLQQPGEGAVLLAQRIEKAAQQVSPPTVGTEGTTSSSTTSSLVTTAPTTKAEVPTAGVRVPKKAANAGKVLTQDLSGDKGAGGIAVRNRSGKVFDIVKELQKGSGIRVERNSEQPQVLILHTHTTENYLTYDAGFYNPADVVRTKDMTRNVCAAGKAVADALNAAGIYTLHDTTIHDNPQYTGAYGRSEQTAAALLKKYPSIKVVLDVHRDAILPDDTTHVKPTAAIEGKNAAQMMIVAGVVSTDALPHPNWQKNFSFALQLHKKLSDTYPSLMRPLYVVASRYNQHLSPGYLLVEIGSDVNTEREAVYSGQLLGKTLAEIL